ncbi:hypothetical protein J6590_052317 [Homalodisca vitripennis]|nr:hypothetical protein J6590_052317 [Homalodisca vitripennis]
MQGRDSNLYIPMRGCIAYLPLQHSYCLHGESDYESCCYIRFRCSLMYDLSVLTTSLALANFFVPVASLSGSVGETTTFRGPLHLHRVKLLTPRSDNDPSDRYNPQIRAARGAKGLMDGLSEQPYAIKQIPGAIYSRNEGATCSSNGRGNERTIRTISQIVECCPGLCCLMDRDLLAALSGVHRRAICSIPKSRAVHLFGSPGEGFTAPPADVSVAYLFWVLMNTTPRLDKQSIASIYRLRNTT